MPSHTNTKNTLHIKLGDHGDPIIINELEARNIKRSSSGYHQNPKSSDETKLSLTNSYSSDPQSPSMMTYCS